MSNTFIARIRKDGKITIPKDVRDLLQVQADELYEVTLTFKRACTRSKEELHEFYGKFPDIVVNEKILEELRKEYELAKGGVPISSPLGERFGVLRTIFEELIKPSEESAKVEP